MTTFAFHTSRRRIAVLAVVGGLAASGAPRAAAEDALPPPPDTAVPEAALPDAGAIAAAALAAAIDPSPAEQAPEPAPEQSEPVVPQPEQEPGPTPPVLAAPSEPPAAVSQVAPVNVNVSIRLDSPGDEGAVTQTNVAVVAVPPVPAVSPPRYHEEQPQYQAARVDEPTTASAPLEPVESPRAAPGAWIWNWDCVSGIPPVFAPSTAIVPQTWIWNWTGNCDAVEPRSENTKQKDAAQYQAGVTQYQPINVNVSIRIGSPGSNAPVAQMNAAVSVTLPQPPVPAAVLPPVPAPPAPEAAPVAAAPVIAPLPAGPVAEPPAFSPDDPEPPRLVGAASVQAPPPVETQAAGLERELAAARTPSARLHVTERLVQRLAAPRPALEAAARSRAPERRHRAPLPADLTRERAVALGTVSPGPATTDRAPLLLFVVLAAFVLAFADAAWRVRDEWRTVAAEPGRRRERPG